MNFRMKTAYLIEDLQKLNPKVKFWTKGNQYNCIITDAIITDIKIPKSVFISKKKGRKFLNLPKKQGDFIYFFQWEIESNICNQSRISYPTLDRFEKRFPLGLY